MPLVMCDKCGKKFNKFPSQIKKTKGNFCSSSCAASFNNKKYPKRHNEGSCVSCNTGISKRKIYCNECLPNKEIDWSNISYLEIRRRYNYQKNSLIRMLARRCYRKLGAPKRCAVCGYSKHYNVCHRKPVHSFDPGALISEINDIRNLVALCPNHHWEFDNGLLLALPELL